MISLEAASSLPPAERYALELLVDLARILPTSTHADASCAPAVRVDVSAADGTWNAGAPAPDRAFVVHPGAVSVPRGVLREIARLASADAEQRAVRHDRFGRVPSDVNALVGTGTERDAPVSRLAVEFRQCVVRAAERRPVVLLEPWPQGHRWAVALTHDVDVVALWPAFTGLRLVELLKRGDTARAWLVLRAALASALGSPVLDGIHAVLHAEAEVGAASTWFVLCGTPTLSTVRAGDLTYRPESRAARQILRLLFDAGHEIGLHGSFRTMDDPSAFGTQRGRLAALAGPPRDGVRQHYLRFRFMDTAGAMRTAGFQYDSSIGFADRNGFRLGVADVLPLWDSAHDAPTGLDEAPFAWMDRALSKYRGIESPDAWVADALELAATCRAVEGAWVGIWHPNLTTALGFPGSREAYQALTRGLAASNPYLGTLGALVAWRRARRSARAVAVRPDGRLVVEQGAPDPGQRPGLETPEMRPLPVEAA